MALKNIKTELEALAAWMAEKDKLRKIMMTYSHDMIWDADILENGDGKGTKGLKGHYFGSSSGGTAFYVMGEGGGRQNQAKWEKVLKKYIKEAIDNLHDYFLGQPGVNIPKNSYIKGKFLHVYVNDAAGGGPKNPYTFLQKANVKVLDDLVESSPDYKELFWGDRTASLEKYGGDLKQATYGMGQAVNVGHRRAVSANMGVAVGGTLERLEGEAIADGSTVYSDKMGKTDFADDYKNLQAKITEHSRILGELKISNEHNSAAFQDNKISSGTITFMDEKFYVFAEPSRDNRGKEAEQELGDKVAAAKDELGKLVEEFITKHGTDIFDREGSRSIRKKCRDMMISDTAEKLTKKKQKKIVRKDPAMNKTLTQPIGKIVNKSKRSAGSPLANTKGKTKRSKSRGATEHPDSLAPLLALLNAKLPRVVAQNMGDPRLENRTGRFAGSVRVTDVNRTAQGHPSIGYTYRKNPYQVFEQGAGTAPWASADRDPRKLIDASIREIAAQMAVGRFYTRRV